MTTWTDDEFKPGLALDRFGWLDEPDTCTLEQYRRWQLELPLFDDLPGRPLCVTVRVRDEIL